MRSFSKKEALLFGWQRFKERPLFLIGLFILTTVISGITGFVADEVGTGGVGLVLNVLDFSIQIILGMGMTLILLRVYDRVETDYTDLLEPLHLFWKYLVMTILVLVVVLIGFVFFVIPGVIAGIALAFASYLIIDRNLGPVDAMKESLTITHGHRWNLFIFGLIIFLINILGMMLFGLGLLVTIPISALATVHVYRWLLNPPADRGVEVSIGAKILGTLAFLALLFFGIMLVFFLGTKLAPDNPESRDAQRRSDLIEVKLSAALYQDVNGFFPTTLSDMVPEYLDSIPTDPVSGEPYSYTVYAEGTDYEICTILETIEEFGGIYCEFGLELGSGEDALQEEFFVNQQGA